MQAIFINCQDILKPDFFAKYIAANGEYYHRVESAIDNQSFDKDSSVVRIELYKNSTGKMVKPVLVSVICRQE